MKTRDRLLVSAALGSWGAFITWFALSAAPQHLAKDFTWPWRAARVLLEGNDPYRVIQATGGYPFNTPLLYPLPAAIVALPFAPLGPALAGTLFVGLGAALLAFGLTRDREGVAKLPLFASAPFCMAAVLAQWAPLMTAAALLPALQVLAPAKPNLGLVAWLWRPSWRGALAGVLLVAVTLIIHPAWPAEWRAALATAPRYRGPALSLGGAFLLIAIVKWRLREGRLFLAMAVVPQLTLFYDQLPLWLIPSTAWRSVALSALSWVAWAQWYPYRAATSSVAAARPWIVWLIYVPALLLVLLHKAPASPDAPRAEAAPEPESRA
jgi:hypothetical protein